MIDRARTFKENDLEGEKVASLGRVAAGLAHELNNPASAATRGAKLFGDAIADAEDAARVLGAAQLTESELRGRRTSARELPPDSTRRTRLAARPRRSRGERSPIGSRGTASTTAVRRCSPRRP